MNIIDEITGIYYRSVGTLQDLYYGTVWAFKNAFTYRKAVLGSRPWDSAYLFPIMKVNIEQLRDSMRDAGYMDAESKVERLEDMNRAIELLDHIISDDYADRCGYDYDGAIVEFVPFTDENGRQLYRMDTSKTPVEVEENNRRAINDSMKLQESEWNELFEVLKKSNRWWT